MQTDKVEESLKVKKGYIPKQAFSFYKYMTGEEEKNAKKEKNNKTRDDRDKQWNKELAELNSANAIMRSDMLKMRERLKPLNNQGFNYSDRKTAKGTKIWVKDGRKFID